EQPVKKPVEEHQPERNQSHSPLFQVMLIVQNAPRATQQVESLRIEPVPQDYTPAKFDLSMVASESEEGLHISLVYNTDIFDEERIERMLEHFRTLLEGVVVDPDQRVSRLPMLRPGERHRLLVEWNNTAVEY